MRLYTFPGAPNPLRVQLFMAEKGIEIGTIAVDLATQQQLSQEYRGKNPNCDVPMLELSDGTCISQIPAIMMYLEKCFPEPSLYGGSDEMLALAMMWEHLMSMNGLNAVADVLRNTSPSMKGRALVGPHDYEQIPALAERGRARTGHFFDDLNDRLAHREYVVGNVFTVADITAWVSVNFARWVKETPTENHGFLKNWYQTLEQRPAFQSVLSQKKS